MSAFCWFAHYLPSASSPCWMLNWRFFLLGLIPPPYNWTPWRGNYWAYFTLSCSLTSFITPIEGMTYGSHLFSHLDRPWITSNHCDTGRSPKEGVYFVHELGLIIWKEVQNPQKCIHPTSFTIETDHSRHHTGTTTQSRLFSMPSHLISAPAPLLLLMLLGSII